jgi:hypothetical protein
LAERTNKRLNDVPHRDDGDEIVVRPPDRVEAWSRAFVVHLVWIGVTAAAVALQFGRVFSGLYYSDAMDLAQLGRHLAAGQGYVTTILRPIQVALYPQVPSPELFHPPLYPLVLALVFNALPQTDAVVAGVSVFFFLAAVLMIYLLASRMFDRAIGALAAVLFALNAQALTYAVSGLHLTLWAFLVTVFAYLIYANPGSFKRTLAAGAVLGLCWLTEHMTCALIIPGLIIACYGQSERRLRHLAWFAVGVVVVMAPWWIRNFLVAHDPFFNFERYELVMFTGAHPGYTLFRTADASALHLFSLIASSPLSIIKKAILGLASAHRTVPVVVGAYLVGFFVIALMRPLAGEGRTLVRNSAILLLVFLALFGAFYNPTAELFFVLVPLIIVLCAGYFVALSREWIKRPGGQAAAAIILVIVTAYPALVGWAAPPAKAGPNRANLEYLQKAVPEKAVVVTDAPWAVAWYARRPSLWLPLTPDDFKSLDGELKFGAIYFSSLLPTYPATERPQVWQQLYFQRATPPGFAPVPLRGGELLSVRRPAGAGGAGPKPAP